MNATVDLLDTHRRYYLDGLRQTTERINGLMRDDFAIVVASGNRIDPALQSAEKVRNYLASLRGIDGALSNLRTDYAGLLLSGMTSAAQSAADRQAALEELVGMPNDPELVARQSRKTRLSDGDEIVVLFGNTADSAARTSAGRTYADGLRIADRITRLDALTRRLVEDAITRAIAAGTSGDEIARQLQALLTAQGVATPLYMAQRIAITEMNNAYRLGTIMAALQPGTGRLKDGIIGLRWNLSIAHAVADICDDHASNSSPGLPSGVYLPDDVPDEHPNGMCYLTPEFTSGAGA